MSNNNGNDGGAFVGLALVFAALYIIGLVMYAIACFIALIFTVIAFLSWDKPLHLFGEEICNPQEARIFMTSAVIGGYGLSAFVFFCSILFGHHVPNEWWFYIFTSGYSFLSIGVMMHLAEQEKLNPPAAKPCPVIEHAPSAAPSLPPAPPPFRYASWDDDAANSNNSKRCNGCAFRPDPAIPVYRR